MTEFPPQQQAPVLPVHVVTDRRAARTTVEIITNAAVAIVAIASATVLDALGKASETSSIAIVLAALGSTGAVTVARRNGQH